MTRLWVYSLMRNEAPMLPYFLRHYCPLAERVILYDDASDDGGMAQADLWGNAEVRAYPHAGLDDLQMAEFASRQYHEARGQADWIIWVDADELIWHPDLLGLLARYTAAGVTLPRVAGYQMLAQAFPDTDGQIYEQVKHGVPASAMDKPCVVDPRLDIVWGAGKHNLERGLERALRSEQAEIKLLHFRHLGAAWFDGRNARNYSRISPRNIERQLGWQVFPEHYDRGGWPSQVGMFAQARQVIP